MEMLGVAAPPPRSGAFAAIHGPGVTCPQYASVNQTVYHAEEVMCSEAGWL